MTSSAKITDFAQPADKIRQLNDLLRTTGCGGRTMLTAGCMALPDSERTQLLQSVAQFVAFDTDNDPYDEHDCAVVQVEERRALWKIDYYSLDLQGMSPDPADPEVTCRVLTIMLCEEY